MVPSVLGKRTRSSALNLESAKSAPITKRVKRQSRTEIFNDENDNPFVGDFSRNTIQNGEPMDIDENSKSFSTKSVPAKHGVAGKCILQNPTPQTPRHRDALSNNGTITPRHRVIVAGKPLTPRTPRAPVTPGASIATVYSRARQLFVRSSEPGRLVGREAEREELSTFIQERADKASGGCIYVSGPPGTGKSAMVSEVTDNFEESDTLRKEYINCMSMKTSKDLYGKLLGTFCGGVDVMEGDELKALQGIFVPRKKTKSVFVVTLDEIDHVLSLDLEILYKLFEWSLQKPSHLILIGIANALDLTDRFLPRLKARNLKPQLLPFLPYNATQIKSVITTRLKSLVPADSPTPEYIPFLHPAAIELCSRKVSSQTGDLRKAFDICRRAIDLIEAETKQKHEAALKEQLLQESPCKKPLEENKNLSSPAGATPRKMANKTLNQSLSALTVETAPRALISHVNKITSSTFGNGANQRLRALNLQQKAALCALVALEKKKREAAANVMATPSKSKTSAPTIKQLYGVYSMLCTRDSILHPLTSTEFRDVVGSLETLSLVSAVDGRNGSFIALTTPSKRGRKFGSGAGVGDEKRVGSCVGEKEVVQAVEGLGAGILRSILSGEGLDDMHY
ncbi:related to cell division control protein CDC18+ [Phialocephala subalpina]|uniref:Cell division control protein n=1 Tax=Phialocephala subalpina TaxID=576137 RepID=A0A1L7WD24_9HELO|nr:related to cell division control protein CDC18+ [Phialocephala subalpina]